MPLSVGTHLGPYEITAPLGAGGMGEVYRARDARLNRDVALKVLPEVFSKDAERMARFEREAQLLASLNHPNIAALYGLEESNGVRALVMELVEGPTLAERIGTQADSPSRAPSTAVFGASGKSGPIPIDEALPIARQIAEALEYAHERGVVHRDLKPANIKLTREGQVKVLGFGLAKALEDDPLAGSVPNSPTMSLAATRAGVILGTAGYMSPEQARGKPVDRRADIWSFGVVLFEMLAGRQIYSGETVADTLASVMKDEPKWDALPADTPMAIRKLLRRCLERDPSRRLQAMGEARIVIEEELTTPSRDREGAVSPSPSGPLAAVIPSRLTWVVVGMLAIIAAVALAGWWRAARPVDHPLMRLSVDLGPDVVAGANSTLAISPDGTRIVFPMRTPDRKQQLATRLLDQAQATLLPGTENAGDPFFSPDGQWVGFFAGSLLKKVAVQGGAPVTLCDAPSAVGATWGEDGNIIAALTRTAGLWRVPAAGGTPQALTTPVKGDATHRWPQLLPGGQAILFTASPNPLGMDDASIEAVALKTGERKALQRGGYFGRYLPTNGSSGELVYVHEGVLFAVPFDVARLELRGTPTPLLEDVASSPAQGGGQFDFSRTGTFVYLAGKEATQGWPVVWLESSGKIQPLVTMPGAYYNPRLSPDGQRLALQVGAGKGSDISVFDWQRDAMTRLTFTGRVHNPVWTPDGKHVAFASDSADGVSFSWIRSDGAGEVQRLLESHVNAVPWSFSPDSRRLAYFELSPETGYDLWTLPLDASDPDHPKPGKPELFLRTRAAEAAPAFSPDGRWIAYYSTESGRAEVYVRPFPGGGGKWQISTGGGNYGIWSNNGRELFYETPDNRIMVVDYTANGDSFLPGKPRLWSDRQIFFPGYSNLTLAPDGKRFAVYPMPDTTGETNGPVHVTFLLNFFDELRRRAPVGGK